jgi:hypothetical protein
MKRTTLTALAALGLAVGVPVALSVGSANGIAPAVQPADKPTETSDPADKGGNPHLLTLGIDWHLSTGSSPASLDAILPDGWQDDFELRATATGGQGSPMSATCTYNGDELECVYVNHGNENEDKGMMILPKPGTTVTVVVEGVPTGWTVDASTVGTFLGETVCPKMKDRTPDTTESAALRIVDAKASKEDCVHTVKITQTAAAPTTTAAGSTTTSVASEAPLPLPVTGSNDTLAAALLALGLVTLGFGTHRMVRRPAFVQDDDDNG